MEPSQVIATGGGSAGLVIALVYVGRLFLDWVRESRTGKTTATTTVITSAETANAVILKSLEALERENGRLRDKIQHLENEAATKDAKIRELDKMLHETQEQLQTIADELTALKGKG